MRRVVAAAVPVLLVLGGVTSTAAAATGTHSARPRPRVSHVVLSSRRLTSVGGKVSISAHVRGATGCTLHSKPAVSGLPATKSCGGQTVQWRPRLPANTGRVARRYVLTVAVHGVHRQVATKQRTIVVEPTPLPRVSAITQSTSLLPNTGGRVTFRATLANAVMCTLSATPAVAGLPHAKLCAGKAAGWSVKIPANTVAKPKTYRFGLAVRGEHGTATSQTRTVTEAPALPATCPGQTSTAPPTTSAYFNDPTTAAPQDQDAVVNAMINLICSVSAPVNGVPSTVDIAALVYQLQPVTDALLWVHVKRSATINVVLDGANGSMKGAEADAYDDLVNGLPAHSVVLCGPNASTAPPPSADDDGMRLSHAAQTTADTYVGTGCAGDNILHTKMLLVSSVDSAGDSAVFTGSQNFNSHGELAAFNNGLQLVGSPAIYKTSTTYFQHLHADAGAAATFREPDLGASVGSGPVASPEGTLTESFDPRNSPAAFPTSNAYNAKNDTATDSTANLLNTVDCTAPGDFAGDHSNGEDRTTVQIAMYTFNARPRVISALAALAADGCEVQVMYTVMATSTMTSLQAAGITPVQLSDNSYAYSDGSGTGRVFIHDKYLLISGGISSSDATPESDQNIVLTGSENLTQVALHQNDEMLVQVQQTATGADSTPLYDAYETNWNYIAGIVAAIRPTG